MDKQVVENLSKHYLDKIADHYGYSKYHATTPYLAIEDSPYSEGNDKDLIAEYCSMNNEIIVYWGNVKDEESLIRSIVHEYQHYMQSPMWMQRYYTQGYDYNNHPYEVAAYKEEENWHKFLTNRL